MKSKLQKKNKQYREVSASTGRSRKTGAIYDFGGFKSRNARKAFFFALVFTLLFLVSVFKNISYPLFWADESATVIGSERVVHFGYPKVHDGKNVFYDLRHSDPRLGIDVPTDAYVGGSGWGQFYFGTIGYKLSQLTSDIYTKTGIYRTTFAVCGLLGIFFTLYFVARLFQGRFSKYAFIALFFLMELCSVSLIIVLKQVRYYSISLLLISLTIGIYSWRRFYKQLNPIFFISSLTASLWLLFNTFSPVYFLMLVTLSISEFIIGAVEWRRSGLKSGLKSIYPVVLSILISLLAVWPLLSYYRTFGIAKAMAEFNGYDANMYWNNLTTVFVYFEKFDFLWLAILLKLVTLFNVKKLVSENNTQFRLSNFLTLFFVMYCLAIARIPNFIFTRYFIPVQPFFTIIIILDFFLLLNLFSVRSVHLISPAMYFLLVTFCLFFVVNLVRNSDNLNGKLHEMTNRYEGPLDYAIPYIKEHYPKTDDLVIATNYEETSFMYYLDSKAIVGFVGNNLAQDSLMSPEIIMYRRPWGNFGEIFNKFVQRAKYSVKRFPIKDQACNDIPELNFFTPEFNHQFYTVLPENENDSTELYFKNAK